jgi:hypothetical protein
MKRITLITSLIVLAFSTAVSCLNKEEMENRLDNLDDRITALEETVAQVNDNALAISKFAQDNILIVKYTKQEHGYELELSDGTKITITDGATAPGIVPIVGIDADGNWIMSIDSGNTFTPIKGATNAFKETGQTPQFKIDADGFWMVSIDGGKTYNQIIGPNGKPISATDGSLAAGKSKFFTDITYDKENGVFTMTLANGEVLSVPVIESFYIKVSGYAEKAVILLDQTLKYKVEMNEVKDAFFNVPEGWRAVLTDDELQVTAPSEGAKGEYTINLVLTSVDGFILNEEFVFTLSDERYDASSCKEFNDWKAGNEENLLLDFSYAGYMHGEIAPPEAVALGYKVYNVVDYGAIPNDGKSDRDAFLACVEAATGVKFAESNKVLTLAHKEKANAIVYFPEGEFILHTTDDNYTADGVVYSRTIQIRAGNFVLRGAGRDKTTIVMQDPNLPVDAALYSSPVMLDFKHNSSFTPDGSPDVVKNAEKGAFSVEVSSASALKVDSWVVLSVQNNDPAYVAEELKEGKVVAGELGANHDINKNGVKVYEYHQIKSIDGNVVTFYEPIHHAVDVNYKNYTGGSYNWKVMNYPHYENVGIEDLTFKGNCKSDFKHHGSWEDDGAYKPLSMTRLVNSWLRRVRFTSVSEACSVTNCSNVSVYDVIIDGKRGHSSIRSQVSTRVFIGATVDKSNGYLIDSPSTFVEGAGQYHAVGVSKPSIGTVLWRNVWGSDACFEAHATQPRATLIDCCTGGWMKFRQGGDANQVPNHLADLTVWNFCSVTPASGTFNWWDHESQWWKFLPPIVVGFHGQTTTFDESQMTINSSNGIPVNPESLFEAQIKERLGAVPAWIESLK